MRGQDLGLLNLALVEARCDEAATLITTDSKLVARLAGTPLAKIARCSESNES